MTTGGKPESREPMLDIAGGDEARSRRILRTVRAARDRAQDPELRALLDDVANGRRGARDLLREPAFARAAAPALVNLADAYRGLSEEERAEAAEEGRRQEEEVQAEVDAERRAVMFGPPPSSRGRPDDEDDDEDFETRSYLR
ncbi:hypothetical protein [Actinoalloteichus spitiensis]|uniref:hypothetical protein n=1 Tax=Actinoalloteichus spitiensis TaxID=252394 RepID=UPI00036E157A|nr:hypothetical protein [Actinoalloteichus spitiensis]